MQIVVPHTTENLVFTMLFTTCFAVTASLGRWALWGFKGTFRGLI